MADNLLKPDGGAGGDGRPAGLPDKFWDPEQGTIRVDALLKSYLELERQLAAAPAAPDQPQMLRHPGVPDQPDGYQVRCDHGLFEPDPEINRKLHGAGFTPHQAQLLYDLAAERFLPLVQEIAAGFEAERQLQRLVEHFGGEEKWRETSRQMLAWAERNLPPAAVEGLATTAEGVLALHRLMSAGEPVTLGGRATAAGSGGEAELQALMRDPRYWRDRQPDIVARVTDGFARLYPGGR